MSKEPKRNVYVGHRYVPKVMGEWDKTETYEGLSIVTNEGTSYTSKKRVPKGIDILNEEYWVVTGNYNAQIEEYRKDVREMEKEVGKKSDQSYVDNLNEKVTTQLAQTIQFSNIVKTYTVGSGGDFETLNEGLEKLSEKKPKYIKQGLTSEVRAKSLFELKIKSGFIMNEQVILEGGMNLGHIIISSEDDFVAVERNALEIVTSLNKRPLLSAHYNSTLPIINTRFKINKVEEIALGNDDTTGIYLVGNSSVIVTSGSGVNGAGFGLHVNGGSSAYVRESNFDESFWGVRVSQGSHLSGREMSTQNCVEYGIAVATGCILDIRGSNVSNAGMRGLFAAGGSFVDFRTGIANNCEAGLWLRFGAHVVASQSEIKFNEIGVDAKESQVTLWQATISENSVRDLDVGEGSIINAYFAKTTNSNESTNNRLNIIDTNVNKINEFDGISGTFLMAHEYPAIEDKTVSGSTVISIEANETKTFTIRYSNGVRFSEPPVVVTNMVVTHHNVSMKIFTVKNNEFTVDIKNDTETAREIPIHYIAMTNNS